MLNFKARTPSAQFVLSRRREAPHALTACTQRRYTVAAYHIFVCIPEVQCCVRTYCQEIEYYYWDEVCWPGVINASCNVDVFKYAAGNSYYNYTFSKQISVIKAYCDFFAKIVPVPDLFLSELIKNSFSSYLYVWKPIGTVDDVKFVSFVAFYKIAWRSQGIIPCEEIQIVFRDTKASICPYYSQLLSCLLCDANIKTA